jgi:hypothetical protein
MNDKSAFSGLPKESQKIVPIREPYEGPLLPFSYTLKLDATIIDRKTKQELHQSIGDRALDIGRRLLSVHPSGGRLRISESGLVIGYEEGAWVVIGSISASEWFDLQAK